MTERIQAFDYSVDVLSALLWNFNNSENIRGLLERKNQYYNTTQTEFWNNWFRDVFDLRTANEFGLSVWSAILDVPFFSETEVSPDNYPAFGFEPCPDDVQPRWVPNYNNSSYVHIPDFVASGMIRLQMLVYINTAEEANSVVSILGRTNSLTTPFFGIVKTLNENNFLILGRDSGIPIRYGELINIDLTFDFSTGSQPTTPWNRIGGNPNSPTNPAQTHGLTGQVNQIRVTDLTTPSNSRFYSSRISNDTTPDDLMLVDELGTPEVLADSPDDFSVSSEITVSGNTYTANFNSNVTQRIRIDLSSIENSDVFRVTGNLVVNSGPAPRFIVYGVGAFDGSTDIPTGDFSLTLTPSQFNENFNSDRNLRVVYNTNTDFDCVLSNLKIERVTDGVLVNFPASQRWVPPLGTNQAYLGNRNDGGFVRGIRVGSLNQSTSFSETGQFGSWGTNRPPIGSLLRTINTIVQITQFVGSYTLDFEIKEGTNEQIQSGFEYPNVFDIDFFDSATEAYLGGRSDESQSYTLGVSTSLRRMSSLPVINTGVPVTGSWGTTPPENGSILTSSSGVFVVVLSQLTTSTIQYHSVDFTDEQIQSGFEWPNHFLVDRFDSSTEAYNANYDEENYLKGVRRNISVSNPWNITAFASDVDDRGSYAGTADTRFNVGSILTASNGAVLFVTIVSNTFTLTLVSVSGTDDEIFRGFEWPNHFTVDRFDAETEGYAGNRNTGGADNYIRGVSLNFRFISLIGSPQGNFPLVTGTTLTASNGASVMLGAVDGVQASFSVISGTDEEIQAGFQWPNHFTVTPP